ncbi:MAG TPA: methionyl-tRNA formyltransferase [Bacteroidales bacterium]|nr:methionyl-tRNA formyltransferase [Bacteroidales bacterium]
MKDVRIVFMGTPEIAVESLKRLLAKGKNIVSVVTTPDKPAGRGLQLKESEVKKFAVANKLPLLQPENFTEESFVKNISDLSPDIIIVVAFRKISDDIIKIPTLGAFNLHASLLPQYRGAAPINWAIINGETETGLTTFFLNNKIDTGNIILQRKVPILPEYNASALYDVMKSTGAELVIETVNTIIHGDYQTFEQNNLEIPANNLKKAPKIFKEHCKIDWHNKTVAIHNLIRGLSYIPGAYSELKSPDGKIFLLKILQTEYAVNTGIQEPGTIETDNSRYLRIYTSDGYLNVKELQLSGKKIMKIEEFLRGFKMNNRWMTA